MVIEGAEGQHADAEHDIRDDLRGQSLPAALARQHHGHGSRHAEHQPRERRVELGAADGSVEDYPINLIRQARGFKNRVLFSPIFSLSI